MLRRFASGRAATDIECDRLAKQANEAKLRSSSGPPKERLQAKSLQSFFFFSQIGGCGGVLERTKYRIRVGRGLAPAVNLHRTPRRGQAPALPWKFNFVRRGRRLDDPLLLPLMREVAFAAGKRRRERNEKISPPVKCYAFDSPLVRGGGNGGRFVNAPTTVGSGLDRSVIHSKLRGGGKPPPYHRNSISCVGVGVSTTRYSSL